MKDWERLIAWLLHPENRSDWTPRMIAYMFREAKAEAAKEVFDYFRPEVPEE